MIAGAHWNLFPLLEKVVQLDRFPQLSSQLEEQIPGLQAHLELWGTVFMMQLCIGEGCSLCCHGQESVSPQTGELAIPWLLPVPQHPPVACRPGSKACCVHLSQINMTTRFQKSRVTATALSSFLIFFPCIVRVHPFSDC